ncbi:DNA mismatch repair endonuclease MutL [Sphingobacteriales bacterium UPWRP_1]|nr:DNA mismatch repair protein MutL [Sphingobacteriales bacterium TSM_CSS]PSJ75485.1 DNA mismatch repair endonuclease MutL [Sphingobacteriales bacterium UPWRP_1]
MSDIIKLLPDSVANQIAAGEVVQRPASVVKELLENAIDAGATQIQLIVKEAGKKLIQVIDNGSGMSETDARMCFERHATSKIKNATDLFAIRTMGFRGEAMASIAAVAQVELKTRRPHDDLGTMVYIEGSEVKTHEPCQCAQGTSIAVKNLFYNIPARRNFLKSDAIEYKYILEEFQRVALANPNIGFRLFHNGAEIFHLPATNLRKRVVGLLGAAFNERLVAVELETDFLRIFGFVGKPDFARKTRGEQFFFVNERFIKSSYLNHAVMAAYQNLLPEQTYPFYLIFIDIDPARIDVNVHPTKQEIKFDNEQVVYTFVKTTVLRALGMHSITPSIDFDTNINLFPSAGGNEQFLPSAEGQKEPVNGISGGKGYGSGGKNDTYRPVNRKTIPANWEELYQTEEVPQAEKPDEETEQPLTWPPFEEEQEPETLIIPSRQQTMEQPEQVAPVQLHNTYVLSSIKSGFILIDQQAASERILYERYLKSFSQSKPATQQLLFPQTIDLPRPDAELLRHILPDFNALGYHLEEFGQHTFVLRGIPTDNTLKGEEQRIIENLLEQFKLNLAELKTGHRQTLAQTLARSNAIKRGEKLSAAHMLALVDQLFACDMPYATPTGKPTIVTYYLADIEKQFERKKG